MMECDDVLANVRQEAKITARFGLRDALRLGLKFKGKVIGFFADGKKIGQAETGWDGCATVSYTPLEEREYHVVVMCEGGHGSQFAAAEATIFSRSCEKEAIIVDIDRTLSVSSTFGSVFKRNRRIAPVKDAVDVTKALARRYDLIVVTGRKSYLGQKTKRWLRDRGFPGAPVYFSSFATGPLGHERFKKELIGELKCVWRNITIGIGDRDSDARAYLANGLKAIILREKGRCPPGAIMVRDWRAIGRMLLK